MSDQRRDVLLTWMAMKPSGYRSTCCDVNESKSKSLMMRNEAARSAMTVYITASSAMST